MDEQAHSAMVCESRRFDSVVGRDMAVSSVKICAHETH
jgi:hypothetical protein